MNELTELRLQAALGICNRYPELNLVIKLKVLEEICKLDPYVKNVLKIYGVDVQ